MAAIGTQLPNLNEAILNANKVLSEKGQEVAVTKHTQPKEPVYLQLKSAQKEARNIGVIHLVHLSGDNWDQLPFETLARTTEQVTQAILDRVALFFKSEAQGLYIDENGTIFDFKGKVKLFENKTFAITIGIDDVLVSLGNRPLRLSEIKSEGVVQFIKLENGHTELVDGIDQRKGKGIFIDIRGNIYRA